MIWRMFLCVIVLTAGVGGTAAADDSDVQAGDDDFNAVIEHVTPESLSGPIAASGAPSSAQAVNAVDPCDAHPICQQDLVCEPDPASPLGGRLMYYDGGPGLDLGSCNPGIFTPAAVMPSDVLRALERIGLPASELVVQPPGGETLVNFDTNFYTEQGSFTRRVRLLGQRVDLKIWPSRYQWVFGDGASLASESAGAPYPDLQITHDYQSKGGVSPRVDTTYSAQFSVNGGPWRAVDGTVTIPGARVQLEVRTARPVLVSYH